MTAPNIGTRATPAAVVAAPEDRRWVVLAVLPLVPPGLALSRSLRA